MERRRVVVHPVGDRAQRLAGELLERRERARAVVAREIDLGAVAGREADGVAERPCERGGALERQRDALPQLDRRDVVGDADEREASKVAPGEDDPREDHEREPDEREVRGPAAGRADATKAA